MPASFTFQDWKTTCQRPSLISEPEDTKDSTILFSKGPQVSHKYPTVILNTSSGISAKAAQLNGPGMALANLEGKKDFEFVRTAPKQMESYGKVPWPHHC